MSQIEQVQETIQSKGFEAVDLNKITMEALPRTPVQNSSDLKKHEAIYEEINVSLKKIH